MKVQVAKLQSRLSGSQICDEGDGRGEGSDCMFDGKSQCMGPAMTKGGVQVKDAIDCGMEESEHLLADARLNFNDEVGRTSGGEQGEAEVVAASSSKRVHEDEQIQMCVTGEGQTVDQCVRRTGTPRRRPSGRGRRLSTIAMRMKREPRTRKASALRISPYTNPLHERKTGQRRQKKLVAVRGENNGNQSDKAAGGDSEQPTDHDTQQPPHDQIEQGAGCVQPIDDNEGDSSDVISEEVRF